MPINSWNGSTRFIAVPVPNAIVLTSLTVRLKMTARLSLQNAPDDFSSLVPKPLPRYIGEVVEAQFEILS
jgi:hypothetical protein